MAILLTMGLFPTAGFAVEGNEPATPSSIETPTPVPEAEPSATPAPTETPLPTPATNSSIIGLFGEELYNYLSAIEDDAAFTAVFNSLSIDQKQSLRPYITEETAILWYERTLPEQVEILDDTETFYQGVGPLVFTAPPAKPSAQLYTIPVEEPFVTPPSSLILGKTAGTADNFNASDPMYKINLAAQALSDIRTTKQPCDVVLVLDVSGSMEGTKLQNMKNAAKTFVTKMFQNAPTSRIAIVPFSSSIFTSGNNQWRGLTNVSANNAENTAIAGWINNLYANGSTYSDAGLKKAQEILAAVPVNHPNARVVIMLTDGIPGQNGDWDGSTPKNIAQDAIHWATILKTARGVSRNVDPNQTFRDNHGNNFAERVWNWDTWSYDWRLQSGMGGKTGCGATVYTIGFSLPGSNMTNEYMYRVSSHRPDGTRVSGWDNADYTNTATRDLMNGYYLTADNAAGLDRIFRDISEQMGDPIENVTIKDYIDTHFRLVNASGNALAVGATVTAGSYTGTVKEDVKGVYVEWTGVTLAPPSADGQTPAQTFAATLYVKPKAGFAGGNEVPTNISGISAVYNGATNIGSFPKAKVNVPIVFGVTPYPRSIYLGNQVAVSSLYDAPNLSGWQYDYLQSVGYTVKQGVSTVTGNVSPTTDTVYNITALVKPALDGLKDGTTEVLPGVLNNTAGVTLPVGGANATVYVYKPTFTTTPVSIYLTNTTNLNDRLSMLDTGWVRAGSAAGSPPPLDTSTKPSITSAVFRESGAATDIAAATALAYSPAYDLSNKAIHLQSVTLSNGTSVTTGLPGFTVYVAKPTVTCKDADLFLGDALAWANHLTAANFPTTWPVPIGAPTPISGNTPTLIYTINLPATPPEVADATGFTPILGKDYNFNITVAVDKGPAGPSVSDILLTEGTQVIIKNPVTAETDHHFTVKVKSGTIVINKTGGAAGDSYLFTLARTSNLPESLSMYASSFQEAIQAGSGGSGTVTITGLPKGTYTVTEENGWSWRYTVGTYGWAQSKDSISAGQPTITYNITNVPAISNWLSSECYAINKWLASQPAQ